MLRNSALSVTTLTTISKLNAGDLFGLAKTLRAVGVNDTAYNCAIPSIGHNGVRADFTLSPLGTAQKIEETYCLCREASIRVNFNGTVPICLISSEILQAMLDDNSISVGCQMYHGKGVAFDCFGNILPCTHFADFPLFTDAMSAKGEFLLKEKFIGMWEKGELANKFRDELWQYPFPACEDCQYWGGCIGGCPLLWSHYDPIECIATNLYTER